MALNRKAMGESPGGRRDFMTHMLKKNSDGAPAFSDQDLDVNAITLVTAGSETTSTALMAAVFYLSNNPRAMKILQDEVRGAFQKETDIDFKSTARLPYLFAVIEETLRMFPPGGELPPRVSPGARLNGEYIPEGVVTTIFHYSTFRNPANFADPTSYSPERFLPHHHALYNPKFAQDNKAAFKPFSLGNRDCLGKNLAYSELRNILSMLVFHFDWEVKPGQDDWYERCKQFSAAWEKPPLDVVFRRRQ